MKKILDPSFRYIPSFSTDLKKTFDRIRRDYRQELQRATPVPTAGLVNVSSIENRTAVRH
jgi:hypothetical protein